MGHKSNLTFVMELENKTCCCIQSSWGTSQRNRRKWTG